MKEYIKKNGTFFEVQEGGIFSGNKNTRKNLKKL